MISSIVSRLVILVFGTLYPAYASYKAVRTKNVKEYVKWMMYWIVFALFSCAETFTDVFFSFWFPFYYEIKIILVLWLLSPATKGSSILYRRFVHPTLSRREAEIDEALARATEQGYTAVLHLGTRGVNYATTVLMQTAIKGGGGLVQQLKKSYSLSDLTGEKEDENRNTSSARDETDTEEPRRREHPGRRGYSPRRTQSSSNRVEMYFSEVDVDVRQPRSRDPIASLTNIRSSDDISSGYSSGEALQSHRVSAQGDSLLRTSSVGARNRARPRSTTTKKVPEDDEEHEEEEEYEYRNRELLSSDRIEFPLPAVPLIIAEQTLELPLLLSQLDPDKNKRIIESIATRYKLENTNSDGDSTTGKSSATKEREPGATTMDSSQINLTTIGEIIEIAKVNVCRKSDFPRDDKVQVARASGERKRAAIGASLREMTSAKIDDDKITDEIYQHRLDELKVLVSNAHKAVTNIVSSRDTVNGSTEQGNNIKISKSVGTVGQLEERSGISDSESDDYRAGRYKKKRAPKAPTSSTMDYLDENTSESALKATLVIKTGNFKTFTNESQTKNVFLSDTSAFVKNKTRRKEGFSKLLTVPKSIFNNAFHKDRRNDSAKDEYTSSMLPVANASRSRSMSVSSHGDSLNELDYIATLIRRPLDIQHSKGVDTRVDLGTDNFDRSLNIEETARIRP